MGYPCEKTLLCLHGDAVAVAGRVFHSPVTGEDINAGGVPSGGTLVIHSHHKSVCSLLSARMSTHHSVLLL